MKTKLPIIVSLIAAFSAYAGSATWNLNPATNNWNTATNWTPATVPNSTTDTATFAATDTTSVLTSANVNLATLLFTAAAPSYTIDTGHLTLTFWDEGVRNDSGVQQTLNGGFSFNGDSSAGDAVTYAGQLSFRDSASAGSASVNNSRIDFFDNASADHGVFTNASVNFNNGSTAADGLFSLGKSEGASVFFGDTASGGNATFNLFAKGQLVMFGGTLNHATVTVNGGATVSDLINFIQFSGSTADHATLTLNGGREIIFEFESTAGEAMLTVNPATTAGSTGGSLKFLAGATAGNSNITVNGAGVSGALPKES